MSDGVPYVEDEDLVRRIRAGDEAAVRILYERYEPMLRARARRRIAGGLKRKLGASDLVQETYIAAFRDLADFEDRGPGSFRRWLERILACKANDQVKRWVAQKRAAGREESREAGTSGTGPAHSGPTASVIAGDAEERATMRRAIESMEGDDRAVLELVGVEGRNFDEAGRVLGRSADAARMLYARAVVRLAKEMRRGP